MRKRVGLAKGVIEDVLTHVSAEEVKRDSRFFVIMQMRRSDETGTLLNCERQLSLVMGRKIRIAAG